ncbi:hypothetical protein LCGC14_0430170 [marine sediment metagenome]|uniref:Uncharacterized protein n=1 Tax=marine sediment metagenome TaxID=412755 RepID=A0A0F9VAJ6_9ZZZZ
MGEVCTRCREVIYGPVEYDIFEHPFHSDSFGCKIQKDTP